MEKENGTRITRRRFCELSMLGSLYLANMNGIAMGAIKKQENLDVDIVIIGGGGAGLAAAVSAAESGAKNVIILEKASEPGGNSALTGCIFAVNSPLQHRLGIDVSADKIFQEKMAHCHWSVNAKLIRNVINMSGDIMRWLEDKGLLFTKIMIMLPHPGDAPRVAHNLKEGPSGVTGSAVVNTLHNECRKLGVKIICDTHANQILTGTDGRVSGVIATMQEKEIFIKTKSLILATGGLGGSKKMINRYFPNHGDLNSNSKPQMTGDGIIMAEDIGAIVGDQMSMLRGPTPLSPNLAIFVGRDEVMTVNKEGERFYDETLSFKYNMDDANNIMARQRDKMCYALLDSIIKEKITQNNEGFSDVEKVMGRADTLEDDLQRAIAEGKAMASGSWDRIAEFIGAKPEILLSTVEQYNIYCNKGYDADFLKESEYLIPLVQPPFFAIPARMSINTTFGGIKINHRTEVLNQQDIPIRGLYAVGDNAGSWAPATYSHRYPGSAMSFALCSGYIAGENAAKYTSEIGS